MVTTLLLGWILLPLALLLFFGLRGKGLSEGHLAREDRLVSECLTRSGHSNSHCVGNHVRATSDRYDRVPA